MAKWIDIGEKSRFGPGSQVCLEADGMPVVVFNIGGELLALGNSCPHAGLPLGNGELRGLVITCPYHGYAYNVKTGANVDFPYEEIPARTYPVRLNAQRVEIDLERPENSSKSEHNHSSES